jgi:IS1 family transposase
MLEGASIRGVARITGIDKNTLLRLMLTVGFRCRQLFDARVRNVHARRVQADELWAYVGKKQRRVTLDDVKSGAGDQWLWLAVDSDSKAILSYYVGKRTGDSAHAFIGDLRKRVTSHFQLTTDGLDGYIPAVAYHFGENIDFAQLVKLYSKPNTSGPDWWRPSKVVSVRPTHVIGDPDPDYISTSHVERLNLSVRMHLRRYTRLTNAFSKSLLHMKAAVSLFVAYYNFCRPHQSLRVTPAMEAGLTDHIWTVKELIGAAA